MNLREILALELDRKEKEKWNVIHLHKTGGFYSAYEWNAWLVAVISFNDEVRMRTKDRLPLAVSRYKLAGTEDTFCKVGFPLKSVDKFIPQRTDFKADEDSHLIFTIDLPTPPDGSEVTYERIKDAIDKWRQAHPIKERNTKNKKTESAQPAPTETPTTQPAQQPSTITIGGNGGQVLRITIEVFQNKQ